MKELWFTLNKNKLEFFIWLMTEKQSVEDVIKRIELSDNKLFIKLIQPGYLSDKIEERLFKENWECGRYLMRLTHQPNNKSLKISIKYDVDRYNYQQEINEVNKQLKQIEEHFYSKRKR